MLTILLCMLGVIALLFILVIVHDCTHFVVREYEISSHKVDADRTIVLVSDLHNKQFGEHNYKVIDKIKEIAPDFILIAGDLVTAHPKEIEDVALDFAKQVQKLGPVYYGMGNHEYRLNLYPKQYKIHGYDKSVRKTGVLLLDNERMLVEKDLDVCGLTIDRKYYKRFHHYPMDKAYIDSKVGEASENRFQILLAHNPEYFEGYVDWGADLTVAGHVHGGIMKLPVLGGVISPRLSLFPKYDGGLFEKNGKTMIVSRGLGTHTLPIRVFNPGELIVIRVKKIDSVN